MLRSFSLLLLGAALCLPAAAREVSKNALFGAIAYHAQSGSVGYAADRSNSRDARIEALRQCAHPKCEVVARLRNDCGALSRGANKTVVEKGATRQEAEAKALRRCGEACEIVAWACTR